METTRPLWQTISERALPEGGFAPYAGKAFDVEATAWGILALLAGDPAHARIAPACRRLREVQQPDGSLTAAGVSGAHWPTALGLLAWKKAGLHAAEAERALSFLLAARGNHPPAESDAPTGHDPSLHGWPWTAGTHSWVEPTSLAILALRAAGAAENGRVREGVRMLLDRQLPKGGWNYGNTTVFGQELPPMPAHTGQALCALAGIAPEAEVRRSIAQAVAATDRAVTPFSFCWGLFGLRAWGVPVAGVPERIAAILARQGRYGAYATSLLAMLAFVEAVGGDLLHFLLAGPASGGGGPEG